MPAAPKTCMVGFRTPAGEWVRVVSSKSVFDAASWAFFVFDGLVALDHALNPRKIEGYSAAETHSTAT